MWVCEEGACDLYGRTHADVRGGECGTAIAGGANDTFRINAVLSVETFWDHKSVMKKCVRK